MLGTSQAHHALLDTADVDHHRIPQRVRRDHMQRKSRDGVHCRPGQLELEGVGRYVLVALVVGVAHIETAEPAPAPGVRLTASCADLISSLNFGVRISAQFGSFVSCTTAGSVRSCGVDQANWLSLVVKANELNAFARATDWM